VSAPRTRAELAATIDATLLAPAATDDDVAALCADATRLRVAAVCVSPARLPLPTRALGPDVGICTVAGFPSGASRPEIKAAEAAQAVTDGANEIDMVLDLGRVRAGQWARVLADVAAVRAVVPDPGVLKVICESAALTETELVRACETAETAGADYVKTSTGFSPAGGATVAAVQTMARTVGGRLGVKASGGIRDTATALAMLEAGATRLGLSAVEAVLAGLPE
jgi:deoxyribose-phosphate aldolase